MDKLTEYPKLLKRILAEYIKLRRRRPNPELETFLIEDEHKGHSMTLKFDSTLILPWREPASAVPKSWNSRIGERCQ